MSKHKNKNVSNRVVTGTVVAAALLLMSGSFAVASGAIDGSGNMLGAVFTSFMGNSTISISKAANSPKGSIVRNENQTLATFNVSVKNVKHWATLQQLNVEVPITGATPSALAVADFNAQYSYCLPAGKTYGYGFKGGSCGSIKLTPASVQRVNNVYKLVFYMTIPVYPEQGNGTLMVMGTPLYVGAAAKDVALTVRVASGVARGENCKNITYGIKAKYGYTKCTSVAAVIAVGSARGNTLLVERPYGYVKPAVRPTTFPPETKQ